MSQDGHDAEGYIETSVAVEKIPPVYLPALHGSVALLKSRFGDGLHGIYLYGSVATGQAIEKQSDLDILVIFAGPMSDRDRVDIKSVAQSLSLSYGSLVREVGIVAVSLEETLAKVSLPGLGCFIKHLCVCVEGEDIRPRLPRFRPSAEVARGFNGDYADVMKNKLDELAKVNRPEAAQPLIRQMCRKTLRTAFCLVMPRLNCWTTDLAASFDYFCRCYPEQCSSMTPILDWAQRPPEDSAEFLRTITPLSGWLAAELDRVIVKQGSLP